jgi:rhodanese-related sulfurtransferase
MIERTTIMNATGQKAIPPTQLHQLRQQGPVDLLDVRTPSEFAAAHVPGAQLLPLPDLDPASFLRGRDPHRPLYVLCQSGGRAARAIEKLQRAGYSQAVLVEGGTDAWIAAGLPVNRGASQGLPLIRQVQLIVGADSAVGAALALAGQPGWALLPLLMGCGLMIAGLTGFCGLAVLLARLPWNRGQDKSTASCCSAS